MGHVVEPDVVRAAALLLRKFQPDLHLRSRRPKGSTHVEFHVGIARHVVFVVRMDFREKLLLGPGQLEKAVSLEEG